MLPHPKKYWNGLFELPELNLPHIHTAQGNITCQRVSAWQCCMGGVAFLWERVNFGPRQNKNHPTDQDQIWQAWLRPRDHLMCQAWLMSRHRLRLGGGVVCHDFVTFFLLFFSFFAGSRTAQTDSPIIIVDGSNNSVWCKEVPFVQKCQKKFHLRGTIPQKWGNFPENRHFSAQTKNRLSAITFELMGQTRPNLQGMYRNENSTRRRRKN
jgi:hypothetical protein